MSHGPLSVAAINRVTALAGPNASVRATFALAGGTHARTSLIQTDNPEREFVLALPTPLYDALEHATRHSAAPRCGLHCVWPDVVISPHSGD